MKKIAALIVVLLLSAPARAIELSLEENRGERGSVGYVDMQRLFANSPDAQRAKEGFEDLVRQAEERVNLRKAELLRLRQELDAARSERNALAQSMALAPAPATTTTAAPAAAVAVSTTPGTPPAVTVSTAAAAAPRPRELALPGMATMDAAPSAPAAVSTAAARSATPPSVSSAAAANMFPAPPEAPVVAQAPAGPTPVQRLLELDARIIGVQADIARKESELTHEHDDADRGLLDVESRKTDQVLARLYRAVSEVARREGVSVVIDKTTILYGHQAVDLTDKVLKYLKEAAAP